MNILIVDDSPLFVSKLKAFLIDHQHEVTACLKSTEAFEVYQSHRPDLVFMDILMPDLDGISAMKQILKTFPSAKIVIMSSMGQQSKIIEATQAGAMDYITKPFEPRKILGAIEKILVSKNIA